MEKSCSNCRNIKQLKDNSWMCTKGHIEASISSKSGCPFWEAKDPETYDYKGKIYIQLRPITIKSLILDKANDGDIEHLNKSYPVLYEISIQYAIKFCSTCSDKMKWMIEKGYWRVEEEKFECSQGDKYIVNGREYILAYCGEGAGALLINTKTGNFWSPPMSVRNGENITKEEFKSILGSAKEDVDEVYKTRIPYIKGGE